jgi:hypothetical protein
MNKTNRSRHNSNSMFHYESHFKPLPGFRLNYKYTIRVWLTSILLGTSLLFAFKALTEVFRQESDAMGSSTMFYFIMEIAVATLLSVPSVFLFVLGYNFISGFIFSSTRIKLALLVTGQALCWLSFYIGLGFSQEAMIKNLDTILPYAIATAISIFIYRLSSDD